MGCHLHLKRIFDLVSKDRQTNRVIYNRIDREYLAITNLQGPNWYLITVYPEKLLQNQALNVTWLVLGLGLLSLLLEVSLLFIALRQKVTAPLQDLLSAVQQVAKGEFDLSLDTQRQDELGQLAASITYMSCQLKELFSNLEDRVEERTTELQMEKERSESLLLNILPHPIAQQLKETHDSIAEHHDEVTVLFADIVGFTPLSARLHPIELVNFLNQIFSRFDRVVDGLGLEKIKTIGDAYMVAGGLPLRRNDHAQAIATLALEMQAIMTEITKETGESFSIRVGINTGRLVAGVIGTKKFIYDLWGDTVNVASRMESSGEPGRIQVTQTTYERIRDRYKLEPRGVVNIKGKGEMITYWLLGEKSLTSEAV